MSYSKKSLRKSRGLYCTFIIIGICLLGDAMLYAVLPTQLTVLSLSVTELGLLLSINRFTRLFSNYWAAIFYHHFGPHRPFQGAVFLSFLITIGYGISQNFWYLFILRILWGVSFSLLRHKALFMLFSSDTKKEPGKFLGFFRSTSRTGYIGGMLLGGYLADRWGFSYTAYFLGFITVVALFLLPLTLSHEISMKNGMKEGLSLWSGMRQIVKPEMLSLLFMGFASHFVILGLINSSYGLYLGQLFGSQVTIFTLSLGIATLNGFLLSSRSLLELFFSPFLGMFCDNYGGRPLLWGSFFIQALFMMILALFPVKGIAFVVPLLLFMTNTLMGILLYLEVGKYSHSLSMNMASYANFTDLGSALGPLSLSFLQLGLSLHSLYLLSSLLLIFVVCYSIAVTPWQGRMSA